jgi:ferrochelatase
VSDHVETLGEIDHEAREQAESLGIERFVMTSGLNTSPTFIRALGEMVLDALETTDSANTTAEEGNLSAERLVAAD